MLVHALPCVKPSKLVEPIENSTRASVPATVSSPATAVPGARRKARRPCHWMAARRPNSAKYTANGSA